MIRDTSAQDQHFAVPESQRRRRKLLLAALLTGAVILIAALVRLWSATDFSIPMSRLSVAEVKAGNLVRDANANGKIVAANSPTLYASAAGVVSLKVKAGDTVKRGDVLAEIDSPEVKDAYKRELSLTEQLEAEVARQQILAQKQKLIARRDADQAEIERVAALRAFERIEAAGVIGVVAKNDYLKAKDAVRSTEIRAKHAAQAAELENSDVNLELKTKQAQLQRQKLALAFAKTKLDDLQLKAPMDGLIGSLAIANKTVVASNTALMTLVDLSQLEVEIEVPETFMSELGLGIRAELNINNNKYFGQLASISPEVIRNQVLARVRFEGKQPEGLRQNQRVSARLLIEEKANVLMVARGSFVESEGGRFAYVLERGQAIRRPVQLGATSLSAVEILQGLKAGEQVIISGTDQFKNAAAVTITN